MTNIRIPMKRAGLSIAVAGLTVLGACSNKSQAVDESLKADIAAANGNASPNDLQLAGSSNKSQVVVSAIEGGPESAPKKAAPAKVAKPSPKPVTHVAKQDAPVPAPQAQAPREEAPAPSPAPVQAAPAPQAPEPAPIQAPVREPQRDGRVYKTEGEIFRQMPWIRP